MNNYETQLREDFINNIEKCVNGVTVKHVNDRQFLIYIDGEQHGVAVAEPCVGGCLRWDVTITGGPDKGGVLIGGFSPLPIMMAHLKWGREKALPIIRAWLKKGSPEEPLDNFSPATPGNLSKEALAFV